MPASDILLEEEIGNGFFGTVYKGIVQRGITDKIGSGMGQEKSHYYRVIVAIKMLKGKLFKFTDTLLLRNILC